MEIKRDHYLNQLIKKKQNGLAKIITGIRRCGKSYLLFNLYKQYLLADGVSEENIIEVPLDDLKNIKYRNPLELDSFIRSRITNDKIYYVFIDEIQLVSSIINPYLNNPNVKIGFVDVVLGLMHIKNVDIYITGSNSKMLSSDILTEFRGRGDELRVFPLSYSEFYHAYHDQVNAWQEYFTYGGMPQLLTMSEHSEKSNYLKYLFSNTYIIDVIERNSIRTDSSYLDDLLNIISSSVGSLTNPQKISNTFSSKNKVNISPVTIANYLDYFCDAFIIDKVNRYDIKGRKYIGSPLKYYFTDIGLRNARLNFRQQEENHIMENIIYNELVLRGFSVDVGVVEYFYKNAENKTTRSNFEVDFIANKISKRYYIQSALTVSNEEKRQQEINSLLRINDSFKKIVVVKENSIPWHDEQGILYLGIERFLLDKNAIDL